MNVAEERSKSLWMEVPEPRAAALSGRQTADVAIVGAGIAGLSVAYEALQHGLSVIVLDRGGLARGMTARTTAHLASEWDDTYDDLISKVGEEQARRCYESHAAAIDRIDAIQKKENIDCDFARVEAFLFAPSEDDRSLLEKELEACRAVGFRGVDWAERRLVEGAWNSALRFPDQARFHPTKYLNGLVRSIEKLGGRLFSGSAVESVEEHGNSVLVRTGDGTVMARFAVVASNTPINDRTAIHTKQAPYRTYAIAAEVERGKGADALFWDTLDPYHYVRLQPGDRTDYLIIGGEDHKSGQDDDGGDRVRNLEEWAREYFPAIGKVTHRWSGQVFEPVDGVAFIGRNPGNENVYVVTGDSGQGMTHGALAGMLITDLIRGKPNEWAELYEPERKTPKSALEYVSENLTALKDLGAHLMPGDLDSVDQLNPGQGAIIRRGTKKIAAYRDKNGKLYQKSASCTHLGCELHWNSFEQCWDCACHGSHFAVDGSVLNGPAISPLEDVAKEKSREPAKAK